MKGVTLFRSAVLAFTLALVGTGCYPAHGISSPGASGIVVDRLSHVPIQGALVVVSRVWEREWPNYGVPIPEEALAKTRKPEVITSSNGRFSIPPEKKWMLMSTTDDHPEGSLVIRKAGYKSLVVPLVEEGMDYVGEVLLTPIPAR